jgi:hypothetical protein
MKNNNKFYECGNISSHNFIINFLPYEEHRIILDKLIKLKYCLSDFDYTQKFITLTEIDTSTSILRNNYPLQNFKSNEICTIIANELDRQPNLQTKKNFLLFTLTNLNDNNAITFTKMMVEELKRKNYKYNYYSFMQILSLLSDKSYVLRSLKNGNYAMNIIETIKVELVTRIHEAVFTIKDYQNKNDYFIKSILMESSYVFGLVINYLLFLLWAVTFCGVWIFNTFRIPKNKLEK